MKLVMRNQGTWEGPKGLKHENRREPACACGGIGRATCLDTGSASLSHLGANSSQLPSAVHVLDTDSASVVVMLENSSGFPSYVSGHWLTINAWARPHNTDVGFANH